MIKKCVDSASGEIVWVDLETGEQFDNPEGRKTPEVVQEVLPPKEVPVSSPKEVPVKGYTGKKRGRKSKQN